MFVQFKNAFIPNQSCLGKRVHCPFLDNVHFIVLSNLSIALQKSPFNLPHDSRKM